MQVKNYKDLIEKFKVRLTDMYDRILTWKPPAKLKELLNELKEIDNLKNESLVLDMLVNNDNNNFDKKKFIKLLRVVARNSKGVTKLIANFLIGRLERYLNGDDRIGFLGSFPFDLIEEYFLNKLGL